MSAPAWLLSIGFLVLLAHPGPAVAADLPPEPAAPAQSAPPPAPANASPLAPPSATCLEWSDGCRTCRRPAGGEIACSNIGVACVPKEKQCARQ